VVFLGDRRVGTNIAMSENESALGGRPRRFGVVEGPFEDFLGGRPRLRGPTLPTLVLPSGWGVSS